jgi:hypothetical protein
MLFGRLIQDEQTRLVWVHLLAETIADANTFFVRSRGSAGFA